MQEFSGLDFQRNIIRQTTTLTLTQVGCCLPVDKFETSDERIFAYSEVDAVCFGCCFHESAVKLWLDSIDRPLMEFAEEDHGLFSTRRSCTVRFPPSDLLGRVVIKTSKGRENNSIQDADGNVMGTFTRERQLFHSKRSCYLGVDHEVIGRMKHAQRGLRMEIEFTNLCSVEQKVLLMAAAYLFRKQAEEKNRRRAAAS